MGHEGLGGMGMRAQDASEDVHRPRWLIQSGGYRMTTLKAAFFRLAGQTGRGLDSQRLFAVLTHQMPLPFHPVPAPVSDSAIGVDPRSGDSNGTDFLTSSYLV